MANIDDIEATYTTNKSGCTTDTAPNATPTPRIRNATMSDLVIALPTKPTSISRYENGAMRISSIPRVKRIKYSELDALANDALMMESMSTPGKTNDMYGTPSIASMREPITVPKINMYNAAEITGATRVCIMTRNVLRTSRINIV